MRAWYNPGVRRIGRYILNTLTVLSLVLCVATIALWVRSYWVQDRFEKIGGGIQRDGCYHRLRYAGCSVQGVNVLQIHEQVETRYAALSLKSDIEAGLTKLSWTHVSPHQFSFTYSPDWRGMPLLYRLGFRFSHRWYDDSPNPGYTEARLPDWFLALLTATLPLAFAVTRRRRVGARRLAAVRCVKCGYDLRATPDRCPECGTIPTKVKA